MRQLSYFSLNYLKSNANGVHGINFLRCLRENRLYILTKNGRFLNSGDELFGPSSRGPKTRDSGFIPRHIMVTVRALGTSFQQGCRNAENGIYSR